MAEETATEEVAAETATEETTETSETTQDPSVEASAEDNPISLSQWRDVLPDDLKESPTLSGIDSVDKLAKAFVETKKMVGANTLKVPGKDASDEERSAFWEKLGRPESPDKYEVPSEGMPEGFEVDNARLEQMREAAHKIGITSQQFAALTRADATYMQSQQEAFSQQMEQNRVAAESALRKAWGVAFDQNLDLARKGIKHYGGDELLGRIDELGLGNDPVLAQAFAKIGRTVAEDEIVGGGRGQKFDKTPSEAKAEMRMLRTDETFMKAYHDRANPGHQDAVDKMRNLAAQAYPEEDA